MGDNVFNLADARERVWLDELRALLLSLDDDDFVATWKATLRGGDATEAERQTFANIAIERDRRRMARTMREAIEATADLPRCHVLLEHDDCLRPLWVDQFLEAEDPQGRQITIRPEDIASFDDDFNDRGRIGVTLKNGKRATISLTLARLYGFRFREDLPPLDGGSIQASALVRDWLLGLARSGVIKVAKGWSPPGFTGDGR